MAEKIPTPPAHLPEVAIVHDICQAVSALPDRNSPEHWPEAMLVTHAELADIVRAAISAAATPLAPFQQRVQPWMMECFGPMIAGDRQERNHRFLEEALELVQAAGCSASEAHQLVNYVYGRPVGEPSQEVGGVMVTLAALCLANGLDMHTAADTELARIWTKVEAIRAKQAAKPQHSPLPEVAAPQPPSALPGEQDAARLDFIGTNRVALIPEFEGGWDAQVYEEDAEPSVIAGGMTVRGAIDAAMAAKGRAEGGAA